jgi:glycerate dehydrogenase
MKIVVVDGHTLNPGDLSWDDFRAMGDCAVYERTDPADVARRCAGASIVLTNKVVFDRAVIASLPDLRYIGVMATGYNVVDVAAARNRGIVVTNVPAYGTDSVAQLVFALLLELCQNVGHHAQTVREGRWSASKDFCYWDRPLIELAGLTMGIVGYGRIGQAVGRLARAFGMPVLAYDPNRNLIAPDAATYAELDTLLARSDVVTLHCPLTPEVANLINAERLARMKPTAFLINTSRGGLVNERDLAEALNAGRLAGAGVDVLSTESARPDNPLLAARNCLITPHIAWATQAARRRLMATLVGNVSAFLAGRPCNVVG